MTPNLIRAVLLIRDMLTGHTYLIRGMLEVQFINRVTIFQHSKSGRHQSHAIVHNGYSTKCSRCITAEDIKAILL